MRKRSVGAVLVSALLLVAVASCGSSDDGGDKSSSAVSEERTVAGVLAQVDGLGKAAREKRLLALAEKQGGHLTFYTSASPEIADGIVAAFKKAYDIDVNLFRADEDSLVERVSQESQAGASGADVLEIGAVPLIALGDGLFAHYRSPLQDKLVEGSVHDTWTADAMDIFVATWNTKAVSTNDRPKRWDDLADPKWKGRLALEEGDVEWYVGLRQFWLRKGRTSAEIDKLIGAIAANGRIIKGHSLMSQLLAAGEFDVATSPYLHHIRGMVKEGQPVAWQPAVEPIIGRPSAVAVMRHASNPAAAVLFTDWLLGDGQDSLLEIGVSPTRRDLQAEPDVEMEVVDVKSLAAKYDDWLDRYQRIVVAGRPVQEQ